MSWLNSWFAFNRVMAPSQSILKEGSNMKPMLLCFCFWQVFAKTLGTWYWNLALAQNTLIKRQPPLATPVHQDIKENIPADVPYFLGITNIWKCTFLLHGYLIFVWWADPTSMIINPDQLQTTKAHSTHWPPCRVGRHNVRIICPVKINKMSHQINFK